MSQKCTVVKTVLIFSTFACHQFSTLHYLILWFIVQLFSEALTISGICIHMHSISMRLPLTIMWLWDFRTLHQCLTPCINLHDVYVLPCGFNVLTLAISLHLNLTQGVAKKLQNSAVLLSWLCTQWGFEVLALNIITLHYNNVVLTLLSKFWIELRQSVNCAHIEVSRC